jgi:PAS domain S-box-containing protein
MENKKNIKDLPEKQKNKIDETVKITEKLELYKAIAESTSDYICLLSLDGKFIYTSASFNQLGYEPNELVGKSGFDYVHTDNFSQLSSLMKEYVNAGNLNTIIEKNLPLSKFSYFLFPTKSGEWRDIEANVNTLTDDSGNITSFLFIARDITELKRAENALRESEKRFSRMVTNVPGVVYQFIIHADGSFSFPYINERSRDMFKLDPSEIKNNASLLLNLIHNDWRDSFARAILKSALEFTPFDFTGKWIFSGEERW